MDSEHNSIEVRLYKYTVNSIKSPKPNYTFKKQMRKLQDPRKPPTPLKVKIKRKYNKFNHNRLIVN